MAQSKELFALFSLRLGKRLYFDVDLRPWLVGAATMVSFVLEPADWGPVTYEAVQLLDGGKLARFYASVGSDEAALGFYRQGVHLTDSEGSTDIAWFQMKVE
jgi:hypothetical protein